MPNQPIHLVPLFSTMRALEVEEIADSNLGENLVTVVSGGVVGVEPAPPQMLERTEVTLQLDIATASLVISSFRGLSAD